MYPFLDYKEIKPVNPKEINPEYSLLKLKLKLQYLGHLMEELTHWKRFWCWERLKEKGERSSRGWDGWMASSSQLTWVEQTQRNSEGQGSLACCIQGGCKESDMTNQLSTHASTQKLSSILLQHCLIQGCGSAPEGLPLMSEDTWESFKSHWLWWRACWAVGRAEREFPYPPLG